MRVFADLHHADLYYSLQLLFEKRLGAELYRPIGLDWWRNGFWKVYDHPATAEQYLGLHQAITIPLDGEGVPLEEREMLNRNYVFEDGIYYVKDPTKDNIVNRAITLDKFKEMKFDILISSMPPHIAPFNKLIELYQPQAKHIFQVGNAWGHQQGVKNILASTASFPVSQDINAVFYHQEFDLNIYKYIPSTNHTLVNSYIHYMRELNVLNQYRQLLPNWSFKTYGAGMEDCIGKTQDIANAYINSGWTWHIKPEGDGYGYGLHCSYACGRPTIIKAHYYNNKLGGQLLIDGSTCINISNKTVHEGSRLLKHFSQPEEHIRMCENAYNRFKQCVDFDEEEQKIRGFLSKLH